MYSLISAVFSALVRICIIYIYIYIHFCQITRVTFTHICMENVRDHLQKERILQILFHIADGLVRHFPVLHKLTFYQHLFDTVVLCCYLLCN